MTILFVGVLAVPVVVGHSDHASAATTGDGTSGGANTAHVILHEEPPPLLGDASRVESASWSFSVTAVSSVVIFLVPINVHQRCKLLVERGWNVTRNN